MENFKNNIKRLGIFDMDGCLMQTSEPEQGKPMWEKYYNKNYPYAGWWGRPESLDLKVFDIKPFPSVLAQYEREKQTPNTFVMILTSRIEKLRPYVQAVLNKNNIIVDRLEMKNDWKGKSRKILELIKEFPDLEEINVFDDMDIHIEDYHNIKSQIPDNITFNIYKTTEGKIALTESETKIINTIQEEIKKFSNVFILKS